MQISKIKLDAFFEKFLKLVRALRVNETKVTSTNVFIDNHFALESEKELKNDKRSLFQDFTQILDLSLNP